MYTLKVILDTWSDWEERTVVDQNIEFFNDFESATRRLQSFKKEMAAFTKQLDAYKADLSEKGFEFANFESEVVYPYGLHGDVFCYFREEDNPEVKVKIEIRVMDSPEGFIPKAPDSSSASPTTQSLGDFFKTRG